MNGGRSFTAATPVLLASGKAEPISKLHAGQEVLATDTRTGKDQPEAITAVLLHHDTDLYDLKVREHGRAMVIHTTSSHLFWVPATGGHGHGRWVKAAALRHGTHLRTPGGHGTATVTSGWTPRQHDGWMWDLTIPGNGDHDFYVTAESPVTAAGSVQVLVHNENEDCLPSQVFPVIDDSPQEPITDEGVFLKPGQALEKDTKYHYVVMEDGEFRAVRTSDLPTEGGGTVGGHTSLSGFGNDLAADGSAVGEPVRMAGTFKTGEERNIAVFTDNSGHYGPEDSDGFAPVKEVARDAFIRFGLGDQIGKAVWKSWFEVEGSGA